MAAAVSNRTKQAPITRAIGRTIEREVEGSVECDEQGYHVAAIGGGRAGGAARAARESLGGVSTAGV